MKMSFQLPLYLALALAAPLSVSAATIAETYKQIESIRAEAEDDMGYVAKHGKNCTNHDDYLSQAVGTAKEKLNAAESDLKKGFAKLLASTSSDGTCKAPDPKDVKAALRGMSSARDSVDFLANQFEQRPSMLSSKNGHQLMLAMLAAADGYANCVPKKRNDPNSTPESLAYQSFHDGVIKLSKMLKQLEEDGGLKEIIAKQCTQASAARTHFAAYQSAGGGSFERAVDSAINHSVESVESTDTSVNATL